jgi:hypothetical protein
MRRQKGQRESDAAQYSVTAKENPVGAQHQADLFTKAVVTNPLTQEKAEEEEDDEEDEDEDNRCSRPLIQAML